MYRHIVLFRVHLDVEDERVTMALSELRSLAVLAGVVDLRVERSLDTRKGCVIVEDATFVDQQAFDEFRADPHHLAVAEVMARIADWWSGDYEA
jgi:hypothetical protein